MFGIVEAISSLKIAVEEKESLNFVKTKSPEISLEPVKLEPQILANSSHEVVENSNIFGIFSSEMEFSGEVPVGKYEGNSRLHESAEEEEEEDWHILQVNPNGS